MRGLAWVGCGGGGVGGVLGRGAVVPTPNTDAGGDGARPRPPTHWGHS